MIELIYSLFGGVIVKKIIIALLFFSLFCPVCYCKTYYTDIYKDSETEFKDFISFAIFQPEMDNPLEKGLFRDICKEIKTALKKKGYQEVDFPDSESVIYPDFVIIVVFSWEIEWTYEPPKSLSIPQYHPGQNINISGNITQMGREFNWYLFNANTHTQGYWTSQQINIPAQYKDYYVPRVFVSAYDFNLEGPLLLWQGMAYKYIAKSKGEPQKWLNLTARDLIENKFPSLKKK